MRPALPVDNLATPQSVQRFIDSVCLRFHADWQAGRRPRVENALGALPEPSRSHLLRALLAIELEQRVGRGETPVEEEYLGRFPECASFLASLLKEAQSRRKPAPPRSGEAASRAQPVRSSAPSTSKERGELSETPWEQPASVSSGPPRAALGAYEVLEKLGQGGMGIVYRARQKDNGRLVALKLIRADRLAALPAEQRRPWLERFRAEALAAARLNHDHILPVHDVGLHGHHPYYTMRLVEGRSLADRLRHGPLPEREAAACLECVARAVHHAHGVGILHRDLKPGNILLDGEGRPYVSDFGLAKWVEGPPSATQTGQFLGSPPYAAPEQARDAARATPASDVYGLGATLYHALTGRPPFHAASVPETLRQVEHEEPVPPRVLNPALPRDLELICLQCLQKDPRRRYSSAAALADDLSRFLDGRPIEAHDTPWTRRLHRWVRRNPLAMAAGVILLMALAAVCGGLVHTSREQQAARAVAEEARSKAEESERLRNTITADAARVTLEAAQLAMGRGAWREALASLDAVANLSPTQRLDRVRVCKILGQPARAADELTALESESASGTQAGRGDLYRAELLWGNDPRVASLLRSALARGLPPAERAYAQGLGEAKTSLEALTFFRQAVERDPFHQEARTQAALLLLLLGRRDEAYKLLTQSEALFPDAVGLALVCLVGDVFEGNQAAGEKRLLSLKGRVNADDLEAFHALLKLASPLLEALISETTGETTARLVPQLLHVQRLLAARRPSNLPDLRHILPLPPSLLPLLSGAGTDLFPLPLGAPVTKETVERAGLLAEVHPEGTLAYVHARLALAYADQHRPGTGQDDRTYTELLRQAATAYETASERSALFPVQRPALEKLIHVEALLGAPARAKPDLNLRARAAARVRDRLALTPPVKNAETWEIFWTAAANASDVPLARHILSEWDRHSPEDGRLPHCRAYTEFHAGAYGPAARAARQALEKTPEDPVMQRLLTQARERLRAEAAMMGP